ncbi:DUF4349 domain-containing protein [Streptomyces sp. NPDC101132]|uniref:DUF4349 domain-containing protein n=1 Tax=Streptomyces sp. NPDC101132 TaxID=3366110 RepID=UPI00380C7A3D
MAKMRAAATARRRTALALAALSLSGALALTGCGGPDGMGGASKSADLSDGARREAAPGAVAPGADGKAGTGGAASGAAAKGPKSPVVRPQIIRTAQLSVQVKDAARALASARAATVAAGGYVGNETTRRDEYGDGGSALVSEVTLRVPAERFDGVLGSLEGGGRLLSRKVSAQDVTQQVVDVESRVKSQQASVARVRAMMDRAGELSDVVMLEGELSRRQAELESLLAQRDALKDQTSLATITLELTEPQARHAGGEEDEPGFLDALSGGWDAFLAVLRWIALVLGAALPFLLAAGVVALAVTAVRRTARRVRPAAPDGPTALPGSAAGPGGAVAADVPAARAAADGAPEVTDPARPGQD